MELADQHTCDGPIAAVNPTPTFPLTKHFANLTTDIHLQRT